MADSATQDLDNLRDDAWFSGFTAGEGCFCIRLGRGCFLPMFRIGLRADDLEILETIKREFGGSISFTVPRGRDNAAACLSIARKRELAELVKYFDRFPLRAKKARDYAIWRRAVHAYGARGSRAPELPLLHLALAEGRKYAADQPVASEASPQLRLVS